jgi:hypothetical protein
VTNDAEGDGHHDYVIGKPVAVFEFGGTRYGYFDEESVSVGDTTCPSCGEFPSTIYPVDAIERLEAPDDIPDVDRKARNSSRTRSSREWCE